MNKPLHRLDLNLLITLQLLLQERSVTKAAKKLSVTPSAVSKSLTKLREWFDDPLFVRTPQGLQPTLLSLSMESELSEWFQIGTQLSSKRGSDTPKGVTFQLMMESPLHMVLLSQLPQMINQQYHDANIKIRNWDYDSLEAIISGNADIGFTGRETHHRSQETLALLPYYIDYEVLFTERPMVYMRKDHPATKQDWTLATFLQYAHITVLWEARESWALDEVIAAMGLKRNIAMSVSTFEQSLFMAELEDPKLMTTAPGYCREYIKHHHPNLVAKPIPLDDKENLELDVPFTLMWHKRNSHTPKLIWLKEAIKQLVSANRA
ncbi:HTH-type transcriptional regulator YidZ [Photobacterium sanctipauli]|uniref:HTH-type transcriptional regulator YidZ n=1 Tax=Photobacterium sanctipauli TaxID=1342794 RepID=A0A2T3NWN0_9GAMM|nr:HTH-type transcriptional regulator YidZ [Photobacterium sanctipauli]PSW20608.1 HTH-type transcriptional regulator YidZ [Photobacterium sanctipauli]